MPSRRRWDPWSRRASDERRCLRGAVDATETGVIGKFGSGTKHSVNLCLRNNLNLAVFCGNLRLEFFAKIETMRDGLV